MNQFNRIFRILWSKTKEQWIVTSELEGPGGKKQGKGLVSVFCAALVAAGMLSAAPQGAGALTGTGTLVGVCTGTVATVSAGTYAATCTATLTDTLTNNGTISASSSRVITVGPGSTGVTINNNGIISAGGSPAIFLAKSTPLGVIGLPAAGTNITNTGTIQANNSLGRAKAIEGSFLTNDYTGTIDNSGTISAVGSAIASSSTSSARASAIGMFNRRFLGSLLNTGTISAAATLNAGAQLTALDVRANTIRFRNYSTGAINNSGVISASVTNHGSVSGAATSRARNGIWAQALDMGGRAQVTNSGSITATASNTGAVSGGMDLKINAVAALGLTSNSKTISAVANNSGGNTGGAMIFNVIGVDGNTTLTNTAAGVISAQVTNTGTIGAVKQIYGSSSSSFAFIAGVHSSSFSSTLTNAGSISASVNVPGHVVPATGVSFESMRGGGTLDNSGTISGVSNSGGANGYSLKVMAPSSSTNSGAINNLVGGLLSGNISVAGGVTFTNAGTIDLPDGANNASIVGIYTQSAGGKLTIGASSATSYAKLSTGPANLITGSVIDVYTTPANTLAAGDVLTGVLTSTALTAGALTVTDNSSTLDFTVAVNGNRVDLTAVAVAVADTVAPVITLTGANVSIVAGTTYSDQGATASDNIDGDITANISVISTVDTTTPGTYTVTYDVSDAAGNAATQVIRTVTVTAAPVVIDTTPPVISLIGFDTYALVEGEVYTDQGATALDNIDGDITANITVVSNVDTATPGIYSVTYDVSDAAGNAAVQLTRTVNVVAANSIVSVSGSDGGVFSCAAPISTASQGIALLPMLLTLLAGLGVVTRRKKD